MKVLMFGWEYAPQHTGGLGVVCKELANELSKRHEVSFMMPNARKITERVEKIVEKEVATTSTQSTNIVDVSQPVEAKLDAAVRKYQPAYINLEADLLPYVPAELFREAPAIYQVPKAQTKVTDSVKAMRAIPLTGTYGKKLNAEVTKYTLAASTYYEEEEYDIIHAHDWMGITAGLLAKAILKVPLIAHIHSTELDRNGAGGDQAIKDKERKGLELADAIICVSEQTKKSIVKAYHIDARKIQVIPNATTWRNHKPATALKKVPEITFLGRLTHQKGPGKILDLARELENTGHQFSYNIIGDGYLKEQLQATAAHLNLSDQVDFTGFLEPEALKKKLKKSSLVVIPSVAEPFGLVALEATAMGIPVMISANAGVNEFMPFKTFETWDLYSMKQLAIALLSNPEKTMSYVQTCQEALRELKWSKSARAVSTLYQKLIKEEKS